MRKIPTAENTGRQIAGAKPTSGKQVPGAPGSGRVVTSALRQTLIEQKLIEINTPEVISTWWCELINSPVQAAVLQTVTLSAMLRLLLLSSQNNACVSST